MSIVSIREHLRGRYITKKSCPSSEEDRSKVLLDSLMFCITYPNMRNVLKEYAERKFDGTCREGDGKLKNEAISTSAIPMTYSDSLAKSYP